VAEVLNQALAEGSITLRASVTSWREALELAGLGLENSHRATSQYTEAMVQAFEELGP